MSIRISREPQATDGDGDLIAVADTEAREHVLQRLPIRELDPGIVEIHTLGWTEDRAMRDEDDPEDQGATMDSIVKIDGQELMRVSAASVHARGGDFTEVILTFCPSSVRIIEHTIDDWPPSDA